MRVAHGVVSMYGDVDGRGVRGWCCEEEARGCSFLLVWFVVVRLEVDAEVWVRVLRVVDGVVKFLFK